MALRERLVYAIDVVTDGVDTGLNRINKSMKEAEGWSNKLKAGWKGAVDEFKNSREAQAVAVGAFATVAKLSIDEASRLEESVNAVRVTFGEAADEVLKLGENSAESFGLAQSEFNALSVQFSSFAQNIAASSGQSVGAVIEDLSTRVADFASVMNLDLTEATQVFMSTLAGETEPIRRFGKDVSAAAVEQYALATGLVESRGELTESIKVQARYGLLMESTADTAGDFKATSDSLANSQRILAAQVKDTAAQFGSELMPAVASLTNGLSDLLTVANKLSDSPIGDNMFADSLKAGVNATINPIGHLADAFSDAKGELERLFGATEETTGGLDGARNAIDDATTAWAELTRQARLSLVTNQEYSDSAGIVEAAIDDAADAFKRQEEAARDSRNELREHAEATDDLYEAEYDLEQAVIDAAEALEDGELSLKGVRSELAKVTEAADRQAQALVTSKGLTLESEAGTRLWAESMLETANTLDGPMKAAVMDHISRVTGIPTSVLTTFGVQVDPGALAALEDLLARLGRIANNPFARVSATGTQGGARLDGGDTGPRNNADGGYWEGGLNRLNDGLGPEMYTLPNGSKVDTAANSANYRRQIRGAEQPTAVHFHQHFNRIVATGSPTQVAGALSRRVRGRL